MSRSMAYVLAARWFDRAPTRREVTEFQLLDYPSPDDVVASEGHEHFGSDEYGIPVGWGDSEALGCVVDCDPWTDPMLWDLDPFGAE